MSSCTGDCNQGRECTCWPPAPSGAAQHHCEPQRQPCPNPGLCRADCNFNTASDTGHKVANGWRTDYLGKAAEESIPGELPAIRFPEVKALLVDFWMALVDLAFWIVPAGIVIGLGYGAFRFFF